MQSNRGGDLGASRTRGDNHHAIDDAVKALADGTEQFAAMRMNRGIRAALAGRSVEDI